MADRGMTGAMLAALAEPAVRVCHLVEFQLSEPVYLTNAATTLSWNSQSWAPAHLLSFSDIRETMSLELGRTTVSFSGVDQTGIALLLQYEYLNRKGIIRLACLTEALTVVDAPLTLVSGRLDKPSISVDPESGTCEVSIDIVTRETPLGRARARYTNSASQTLLFSGDRGFENVSEETATMVWGGRGHETASRARTRGRGRVLPGRWGT